LSHGENNGSKILPPENGHILDGALGLEPSGSPWIPLQNHLRNIKRKALRAKPKILTPLDPSNSNPFAFARAQALAFFFLNTPQVILGYDQGQEALREPTWPSVRT
jgi:hypothetical protein